MASSSAALVPFVSEKRSKAVRGLWTRRVEQKEETAPSPERIVESQVDDVFLVLALIGEALLPLGVLDERQYRSTLSDVQTAVANCGHATIGTVFEKMTDELKFPVVAGFTICALFAPMHVYRGFGACVFNDWEWGCPDAEYLERKVKKETGIFSKKPDPQPNRPVLLAFDRAMQVLQVKPIAFLSKRPSISGFAEQQPRYTPRPKKEAKENLSLCEDWFHELEKRGHPPLRGQTAPSWGMPFATWTSPFSCQVTKDPELIVLHQMDIGRLLHAFICRGALNLHEGEILTLPPATPAEALITWLTGLPGMSHTLVSWSAFDTAKFEKKAGKKLCSKIGIYPLPSKYAIRDISIAQTTTISSPLSLDFPSGLGSAAPPPYSESSSRPATSESKESLTSEESVHSEVPTLSDLDERTPAELGERSPVELDPRVTLHRQMPVRHAATTPAPRRAPPAPPSPVSQAQAQKVATVIRRKPTPTDVMSSVGMSPAAQPERAATAPPSQLKNELHLLDSAAPPPRPPKVPLDGALRLNTEGATSEPLNVPTVHSPAGTDMSGHYLQLLNAVAQGHLSPQQLQAMLQAPTQQPQDGNATSSYITAEPQELDSDPAPPKFMGVSIPRGELRKAYLAATADPVIHPSLVPGSPDEGGSRKL